MIPQDLQDLLIKHEGMRLTVYNDTFGIPTIGIGRQLKDRGISKEEALYLLWNDLQWIYKLLHKLFPLFEDFPKNRQYALISMAFNLGESRFKGFQMMINACNMGNWQEASEQALKSKWAKQVGNRAVEIAHMLLKG